MKPKVLVITLYCGEPQLERCEQSVREQSSVDCDHHVIRNKPNYEAHKALYTYINEHKSQYDYFVKLDADMEFNYADSLANILSDFDEHTSHLTIPVFDYYTQEDMPEVHIFSSGVFFDTTTMDALFPDHLKITYTGGKKSRPQSDKLILHCNNPTVEQSVLFGLHRALKLYQKDRKVVSIAAARYHLRTLNKVYKNHLQYPDDRNFEYSLKAASFVLQGGVAGTMNVKSDFSTDYLKQIEAQPIDDIFAGHSVLRLSQIYGYRRLVAGLFSYAKTKLANK